MGRGKIAIWFLQKRKSREIKRIESYCNRQVTLAKRMNEIINKAKEISALFEAKVFLIVAGSTGKMVHYCSGSQETLLEILDIYESTTGKRLWDAEHEDLADEVKREQRENETMRVQLRQLEGEGIACLTLQELVNLEEALENGRDSCRQKKSEMMQMCKERIVAMLEENDRLRAELGRIENKGLANEPAEEFDSLAYDSGEDDAAITSEAEEEFEEQFDQFEKDIDRLAFELHQQAIDNEEKQLRSETDTYGAMK